MRQGKELFASLALVAVFSLFLPFTNHRDITHAGVTDVPPEPVNNVYCFSHSLIQLRIIAGCATSAVLNVNP